MKSLRTTLALTILFTVGACTADVTEPDPVPTSRSFSADSVCRYSDPTLGTPNNCR